MDLAHHDLAVAFAPYKDKLHRLRAHDTDFADLVRQYETVDAAITAAEQGVAPHDDRFVEELKVRRVHVKDKVFARLRAEY